MAQISCDPNDLVQAARCFDCVPPGMMPAVQTYLLAVIAGGSIDPAVLMKQASCFSCIDGFQAEVQVMLLCQILAK